jgi:peroxiredoxin
VAAADDQMIVPYQPVERVLDADSALLTFIRPQEILLGAQVGTMAGVTKAPPFTTTPTPAGTLRTIINGTPTEIAVVSDEKVNGSLWVYLDENGNTDLTDDVHFEEGVDFANGGLFAAGLMGRNDALWLRRPILIDTSVSPPKAKVSRDRMECINRVYLDGAVILPQAEKSPLAGQHRFLLLDTDADGDLADEDGALGVWVSNSVGGGDRIQNAAPLGEPSSFMGYRWRLARKLSGEYALMGQKLPASTTLALRVGDTLPRVKAQTVAGQPIEVAAPAEGYLLLYAWSTWYSACNRDVPFDINDLYPKFKDRGLQMVGVSMDYRKEDLERYLVENKIDYPQIFNGPDATQGVAAELGLVNWPAATLVDAAGVVVKTGESAAEIWSFLDANLPI